jgi:hypothetical protein
MRWLKRIALLPPVTSSAMSGMMLPSESREDLGTYSKLLA